jgi:hypothetical protein
MYQPPGLPPPGWYPDPERPGATRWWSGTAWAVAAAQAPVTERAVDAMPDLTAMISDSFRITTSRWRALLALGLIAGALPATLTLVAVRRLVSGLAVDGDRFVGWSNDRLPVAFTLGGAALVIATIGWVAVTWLTLRAFDDHADREAAVPQRTTSGEINAALAACVRAVVLLPRVLGWGLIASVAVVALIGVAVVATWVVWPVGVLLWIAYLPLGVWVSGKLAFTGQAIVDRSGNPFARSAEVSRGRFWPAFGRVLLAGLVAGGINYGASTISSFATLAGGGFGTGTTFEVDEQGELERFEFDDVITLNPLVILATALASVVTTMFATAPMLISLANLYRTRNPDPAASGPQQVR